MDKQQRPKRRGDISISQTMIGDKVPMKHFLATGLILFFATAAPFWDGVLAQAGDFTPPTYQEVISEYNQKADHVKAYEIGVFYYYAMRGAPKDYAKAREWFTKAANQGSAEACVKLGDIYHFGRGVDKNRQEALQFYRKAAEMESPEGQEKLADMYYFGSGVDRNYIMAEKWYRKAAESGYAAEPCYKLGSMYLLSEGVKEDRPEALYWFLNAYERGDLRATIFIAEIYRAEGDRVEAAQWLKKGAASGDAGAMEYLAEVYAKGEGVERSYVEAYRWLSAVLASEDNNSARSLLEEISKKMSNKEISTAKKLAAETIDKLANAKNN